MTFVEWKDKSLGRYFEKEYFPSESTTFQDKYFSAITYLRSLPISLRDHSSACLIIFLDTNKIHKIFESINFGKSGSFFITNAKGQLLTGFSSKSDFSLPTGISFSKSRGFFEKEIHGEYMSIIHTSLPHNQWRLVAVIPSEIIMAKANYIKNLFLIITVFIIILGAIAASLFAYLNSKPIKNLITNLKERMIEGKAHPSNEYDFLEETFASLVNNNEELKEVLEKQAPLIRGVFIDSLLKGKFSTNEEIDSFSHNDFRIEGNKFLVLLVHIIGYHGLLHKQSFDAINLTRSIVISVLEREFDCRFLIREVDIDKIVLLLSFDTANQDWRNMTEVFSEKLKSHCLDNYNTRLSFSAGSIVENALDIHISYMEAEEALDYKGLHIQKNVNVIWYCNIPKNSRVYYYPMNIENRLMSFIRAGDLESADKIITIIYRENINKRQLSSNMADGLIHEMKGTVIKMNEQLNYRNSIEYCEEPVVIETINNCSGIDEFFEAIRNVYKNFCLIVNENKKSRNRRLKEAIINYLNSSYMDPNICLYSVSSKFGLNEIYLSQFFKEQGGENFHHYLERLRMEKAHNFLSQTDLSIKEIAKKVGYNSYNTFHKTFRRIEGVSPKEFRWKMTTQKIHSISQDS
jgi:AraC-like DNA-binding protein